MLGSFSKHGKYKNVQDGPGSQWPYNPYEKKREKF